MRGDILLGKVYGYTDQYSDLKEILLSNTFTVIPSLRYGYAQKNNADIHLVLDALEVAYTNPLVDSFCIVSGDSDYVPLVGRLKSMGKYVLGISRSEAASSVFIKACNEFQFLETVGTFKDDKNEKKKNGTSPQDMLEEADLVKLIEKIFDEQDEDEIYASVLKNIILRLRPEFNEKDYGCATFGKLLTKLSQKYNVFDIRKDNYNVVVSLKTKEPTQQLEITKDNWKDIFARQLNHYKEEGFDRINPSILKGVIQSAYPNFSEKNIGFKRFSDVMKQLEKDGLLTVEMDDQNTMLIKVK